MELYLLKHSNMTQTGKGVLRMIQNNTLPKVDLLVRECLQNSLDAALPGPQETDVDIRVGKFTHAPFAQVLSGITGELEHRYADDPEADFLAFRDSNTTGLTGPLRVNEKETTSYGNLRKLIYEISQEQTGEGKGGSWGIGKTVCFRAGIGIVVYYSRIRTESGYASRMAATLIENEHDPDSLLRSAQLTQDGIGSGIAWWGQDDPDNDNTMPITSEKEIAEILQIFGMEPYTGEDTGTTVIIPFIDPQALAENANVGDDANMKGLTLGDHLKMAVQRWYMPRYMNSGYYHGSRLRLSFNGVRQRKSNMDPFFTGLQKLYNEAATMEGVDVDDIGRQSTVHLRGVLSESGSAGRVSCRTFTARDLGIENGGLNPYQLIGRPRPENSDDADGNPVIVCYCRNAGMIINYELGGASDWATDSLRVPPDQYFVAFFVLNGDNRLQADPSITLDEYMRRSELADHMNWQDSEVNGKKLPIAQRIKSNTSNFLKQLVSPKKRSVSKRNISGLQRALGKALLPPDGFGKSAKHRIPGGGGGNGNTGSPRPKKATMTNLHQVYDDYDSSTLNLRIVMPHERPRLVVSVAARTGSSQLTPEKWEDPKKGVGMPFPVRICQMHAETEEGAEIPCTPRMSPMGVPASFVIETEDLHREKRKPIQIQCTMQLRSQDDFISSRVMVEEEKE